MSDNKDATYMSIEPKRIMRVNKLKLDPERADKFIEIVSRAYKAKKPAKSDLAEIRKFLID